MPMETMARAKAAILKRFHDSDLTNMLYKMLNKPKLQELRHGLRVQWSARTVLIQRVMPTHIRITSRRNRKLLQTKKSMADKA